MSTLTEKIGIGEFEFSNRALNAIDGLGILTIPDLANRFVPGGKFEKIKAKGVGKKTLTEILEKLSELGYISYIHASVNYPTIRPSLKFPESDSKLSWKDLFDLSERIDFDLTTLVKELNWSEHYNSLILDPVVRSHSMSCWQLVYFFLRTKINGRFRMVTKQDILPFSDPGFDQKVTFIKSQFSEWSIETDPLR